MIIEDGTGLPNAESYISVADANQYLQSRGESVAVVESDLLKAVDFLESIQFDGYRLNKDQSLSFPRTNIYDYDGSEYPPLPERIKHAQAWAAHYLQSIDLAEPVDSKRKKRVKVDGAVEVEYDFINASVLNRMKIVKYLLRDFVRNNEVLLRA